MFCSSVDVEKVLVNPTLSSVVLKLLHDRFPWLHFVEICFPKGKMVSPTQGKSYAHPPKPKRAHNVLSWSNEVKIWDLWKAAWYLMDVGHLYGGINQASMVVEIRRMKKI
jgi:hypothetical protein